MRRGRPHATAACWPTGRPLLFKNAQADGRWAQAYDGARTAEVPEDLIAALDAFPKAKAFFATIHASNRYAVLWAFKRPGSPGRVRSGSRSSWTCWGAGRPFTGQARGQGEGVKVFLGGMGKGGAYAAVVTLRSGTHCSRWWPKAVVRLHDRRHAEAGGPVSGALMACGAGHHPAPWFAPASRTTNQRRHQSLPLPVSQRTTLSNCCDEWG